MEFPDEFLHLVRSGHVATTSILRNIRAPPASSPQLRLTDLPVQDARPSPTRSNKSPRSPTLVIAQSVFLLESFPGRSERICGLARRPPRPSDACDESTDAAP